MKGIFASVLVVFFLASAMPVLAAQEESGIQVAPTFAADILPMSQFMDSANVESIGYFGWCADQGCDNECDVCRDSPASCCLGCSTAKNCQGIEMVNEAELPVNSAGIEPQEIRSEASELGKSAAMTEDGESQ